MRSTIGSLALTAALVIAIPALAAPGSSARSATGPEWRTRPLARPPTLAPLVAAEDDSEERTVLGDHHAFRLYNGCRYETDLRGVLLSHEGDDRITRFRPEVIVTAVLQCPGSKAVRQVDTIGGTQRLTRHELETLLERRATLISTVQGRRCAVVPDFRFDGQSVGEAGVTTLCPRTTPHPATRPASTFPNEEPPL
jgi:hypothetical protein